MLRATCFVLAATLATGALATTVDVTGHHTTGPVSGGTALNAHPGGVGLREHDVVEGGGSVIGHVDGGVTTVADDAVTVTLVSYILADDERFRQNEVLGEGNGLLSGSGEANEAQEEGEKAFHNRVVE